MNKFEEEFYDKLLDKISTCESNTELVILMKQLCKD